MALHETSSDPEPCVKHVWTEPWQLTSKKNWHLTGSQDDSAKQVKDHLDPKAAICSSHAQTLDVMYDDLSRTVSLIKTCDHDTSSLVTCMKTTVQANAVHEQSTKDDEIAQIRPRDVQLDNMRLLSPCPVERSTVRRQCHPPSPLFPESLGFRSWTGCSLSWHTRLGQNSVVRTARLQQLSSLNDSMSQLGCDKSSSMPVMRCDHWDCKMCMLTMVRCGQVQHKTAWTAGHGNVGSTYRAETVRHNVCPDMNIQQSLCAPSQDEAGKITDDVSIRLIEVEGDAAAGGHGEEDVSVDAVLAEGHNKVSRMDSLTSCGDLGEILSESLDPWSRQTSPWSRQTSRDITREEPSDFVPEKGSSMVPFAEPSQFLYCRRPGAVPDQQQDMTFVEEGSGGPLGQKTRGFVERLRNLCSDKSLDKPDVQETLAWLQSIQDERGRRCELGNHWLCWRCMVQCIGWESPPQGPLVAEGLAVKTDACVTLRPSGATKFVE